MTACAPRTPVLTWRESDGRLPALWERLAELGWLPDAPRVVLQVGRQPTAPVMETVRSLAHALRDRAAPARVEGLDGAVAIEWSRLGVDAAADPVPIAVSAIAAPELAVPEWWFEDCAVVTVAEPIVCPRLGLAIVLDAQAAVLARLGNRAPASVLAYEAHRLARSDLAIACGRARDGAWWWAVGMNDVAVERVVAAAAGIAAAHLPAVRAISRHELLPGAEILGSRLPPLALRPAPPWVLAARAACERACAGARSVVRDARTVCRNLHKVPDFVRRRLASRGRGAA